MATKDITDLQVVAAYAIHCGDRHNSRWPYEILSKETGECEKVCYRACERAERRGLIDWGISLRSGWLTEEGKQLLDKSM